MVDIGRYNRLNVVKRVDFGLFLDGGPLGNILLPRRYAPDDAQPGDPLDVFIYLDSDDQVIATTLHPKVTVGQCALLKVTDVNDIGAFLDWGLPKDLLVPFREQNKPLRVGQHCVATLYLDAQKRIVASTRLSRHLDEYASGLKTGQAVDLLICGQSDMGTKAVINHTHLGLIFRDDAFRPLKYGEQLTGYIKAIRPDRKIDLSLQPSSHAPQVRDQLEEQIIAHLQANNGISTLTDKSSPEEIYRQFNVSKGNYKSALGRLYKQRRIVIEKDRITLA